MSSDIKIELSEVEAKSLWSFLNSSEHNLDLRLSGVLKRLESGLWDRLSIDEMALVSAGRESADE